jgi:hypothetical protein
MKVANQCGNGCGFSAFLQLKIVETLIFAIKASGSPVEVFDRGRQIVRQYKPRR